MPLAALALVVPLAEVAPPVAVPDGGEGSNGLAILGAVVVVSLVLLIVLLARIAARKKGGPPPAQ